MEAKINVIIALTVDKRLDINAIKEAEKDIIKVFSLRITTTYTEESLNSRANVTIFIYNFNKTFKKT